MDSAMIQTAAIALDGVCVGYDERTVLDLDHWSVPAGAKGLVTGPSGSGKTTLLHLIAGLAHPERGAVHVFGSNWAVMSRANQDRLRGRKIGLVFQTPRLIGALSVGDNVRLAAKLSGRSADADGLDALLRRLDIAHCAERKPRTLSQGEAQRAALARALAGEPKLILADEPTSALDDERAGVVATLLEEEAERLGATLLIVTHDARLKGGLPVLLDLGTNA